LNTEYYCVFIYSVKQIRNQKLLSLEFHLFIPPDVLDQWVHYQGVFTSRIGSV